MHAKNKPESALRKKSRARRILKWSLLAVLLLLVVVFLGTPVVVSSGGFRKFLLAKINNSAMFRVQARELTERDQPHSRSQTNKP